jgi:pyruvate kinase
MFDKNYPKLIIGIITKRAIENIEMLIESSHAIFYGRGWLSLEIGVAEVTTY